MTQWKLTEDNFQIPIARSCEREPFELIVQSRQAFAISNLDELESIRFWHEIRCESSLRYPFAVHDRQSFQFIESVMTECSLENVIAECMTENYRNLPHIWWHQEVNEFLVSQRFVITQYFDGFEMMRNWRTRNRGNFKIAEEENETSYQWAYWHKREYSNLPYWIQFQLVYASSKSVQEWNYLVRKRCSATTTNHVLLKSNLRCSIAHQTPIICTARVPYDCFLQMFLGFDKEFKMKTSIRREQARFQTCRWRKNAVALQLQISIGEMSAINVFEFFQELNGEANSFFRNLRAANIERFQLLATFGIWMVGNATQRTYTVIGNDTVWYVQIPASSSH